MGNKYPKWGFIYDVNYGYVKGIFAPDGEEIDAYLLKAYKPVDKYEGVVVAIVHRTDNDVDKLVVVPEGENVATRKSINPLNSRRNFLSMI